MDKIRGKCGTVCDTCSFKEQFNCGGCEKQEGKIFWGECDIYKCASAKGYMHCGECKELPCNDLVQFIENGHNPDRLSNLNKWKNEERQHENVLKSFDYNGTTVDLVEWKESIWCGKVGYAVDNIDEPDVEQIMNDFMSTCIPTVVPNKREEYWDVCMSINYLTDKRPNGVFFGFCVETEEQPACYDIIKVPAALYMRVKICDETFKALGVEPWTGGIPPYEWIGEHIAPKLGYRYGMDSFPIFEYYGHNRENNNIEVCYLYVPVQEDKCL